MANKFERRATITAMISGLYVLSKIFFKNIIDLFIEIKSADYLSFYIICSMYPFLNVARFESVPGTSQHHISIYTVVLPRTILINFLQRTVNS